MSTLWGKELTLRSQCYLVLSLLSVTVFSMYAENYIVWETY